MRQRTLATESSIDAIVAQRLGVTIQDIPRIVARLEELVTPNVDEKSPQEAVQIYIAEALQPYVGRRLAVMSVRTYRYDLFAFAHHLEDVLHRQKLHEVRTDDIRSWLAATPKQRRNLGPREETERREGGRRPQRSARSSRNSQASLSTP